MNFHSTIKLLSFLIHTILGLYALRKAPRRRLNQAFCLTPISIAVMELGYFMLLVSSGRAVWMQIALMGQCLAAANIILFSLLYGREDYRDSLKTGKFYLIPAYTVSLALIIIILSGILSFELLDDLASEPGATSSTQTEYGLTFNRAGLVFFVFLFISALIALMNFENTYRQARLFGRRITYPAIVFIGMLSFHLLVYSLVLGFSYARMDILAVTSITLILANMCVAYPVIRPKAADSRIYVSRAVIARSYTLLLAGIYLLVLGMLGKIIQLIGRNLNFLLAFLIAFFVLLALIVAVLSRSLKRRLQLFIERHFYKSRYDYRKEWETFSGRVFSTLNMEELLQEVLDTVSEIIGTDNVSIVFLDERNSILSVPGIQYLESSIENSEFLDWLWRCGKPVRVDAGKCMAGEVSGHPPNVPDDLFSMLNSLYSSGGANVQDGVLVPIIAEHKMTAIMILGGRGTQPYSQADLDILEIMANQISIAIMNAQTSQKLALARELESFHRLSAMLLHDLKSSASMLSLVVQNAAHNFDNPEFQKDALSTMSDVTDRIQKLILRLSVAPQKMEFQPKLQPADLVQITSVALARSNVRNLARIEVAEELNSVPQLMIDPENIERVILNLILNAIESISGEGTITIRTYREEAPDPNLRSRSPYAVVSVSDTGCGMSDEFIRESLFKPFHTTKERGLGLGLYQCKTIIDACGGVMDVQSRQGVGATFAIKLPMRIVHETHPEGAADHDKERRS